LRPLERSVRPAWLRAAALVSVALLLSVFAWWPALAAYPHAQGGDGALFQQGLEAARVSMTRWHELPLWNPYQCGGVALWDNPEGMAAAPLIWTMWLWDSTRAVMYWYVLHSAIGFVSMWLLVRYELRTSRAASLVASAMWAFAGVHNYHLAGGHFNFVAYLYYPLAIFLWRRAERDVRMAIGMGILVAWEIHEGGTNTLPHLVLVLGAETLTRVWPARRVLAIAKAAAVVLVVGFLLGATRFLPLFDQLHAHHRHVDVETDALQWETLKDMFVARDHAWVVPGQRFVWPEYADYIGPILLVIALIGIPLAATENAWLIAMLIVSFALMVGDASDYAPWSILRKHVYPFTEMRVPSRFNAAVTLFLAPLAAIAIDRISDLARKNPFHDRRLADAVRTTVLALAFVGVGDLISMGITHAAQVYPSTPVDLRVPVAANLYYGGPALPQFLDQPQANRARLDCWGEWGAFSVGAPLWSGDVPQARAADDGATVGAVSRTQNTFTIDVDAQRPARILINSAYDRGWRTTVGTLDAQDKQLVLDVPPGRHHVTIKYWPHGLTLGIWLTALGAAGVTAFFVWDARKRRRALPGQGAITAA
jgi:hypothetical protein